MNSDFWQDKRVFITGHSGFKGSWLTMILHRLGATIKGYSLPPPTTPSIFEICNIEDLLESEFNDILDQKKIEQSILEFEPDILFHFAAQPLVRYSYQHPIETLQTNVLGTAHVLEACRKSDSLSAAVIITTDKCYENREWHWGYRENEALGGYDPYSASKACTELVTASWRNSYFSGNDGRRVHVASARAGNVIGGGDWSQDRLLPDILQSFSEGQPALIRNPNAIRPWQHVIEPLHGYLNLAHRLYEQGSDFADAWNFGPYDFNAVPVGQIADYMAGRWGEGASWTTDDTEHPHEAHFLKLDSSKAIQQLQWKPIWDIEQSLDLVIDWHKAWTTHADMHGASLKQIDSYNRHIDSL